MPPEEVAAFFIESIQGEGGYVVPPDDYFQELFKRFKKYGILFVADEVQSGVGRTGKWFGIEHFGVTPDMITLAKALCGGLPIGALVADASSDELGTRVARQHFRRKSGVRRCGPRHAELYREK